MQFHDVQREIKECALRLYNKNLLAACDGNVSYRISDQEILITPTGIPKSQMREEDIAIIDIEGHVRVGKPSSEKLMHLTVYQLCPHAKAVMHAHPPHAVAWSIAHPSLKELPAECMSEVILACGSIPIVEYARPGTQAMGDNLKPYLPKNKVMILSRHGALAWGESLQEAHNGIERLEHSAYILKIAQDLGELTTLPTEEVQALKDLRAKLGDKTL